MHTVLIVEADDHALRAHGDELVLDGYEVRTARSDAHARAKLKDEAIDVVVIGALQIPVESVALLRDLRRGELPDSDPRLPVVALGADTDHSAVRLYQAGADIALPSAASPTLIKGALDAVAARTDSERLRRRITRVGHLTIDADARHASVDDKPLGLTRLEFDLLQVLATTPYRTFRRDELTERIWGYDPAAAGVSRTLDTHAVRLRHKLAAAGAEGLVQTVRGVGYRLSR